MSAPSSPRGVSPAPSAKAASRAPSPAAPSSPRGGSPVQREASPPAQGISSRAPSTSPIQRGTSPPVLWEPTSYHEGRVSPFRMVDPAPPSKSWETIFRELAESKGRSPVQKEASPPPAQGTHSRAPSPS